jgi:hypothetical protein
VGRTPAGSAPRNAIRHRPEHVFVP